MPDEPHRVRLSQFAHRHAGAPSLTAVPVVAGTGSSVPPGSIDGVPPAAAEPSARPGQDGETAEWCTPNELMWKGRLAEDPVLKRGSNGIAYCVLRVLQTVYHHGSRVTQGIDVVATRERAESVLHMGIRKGDEVEVTGLLRLNARKDDRGYHLNPTLFPTREIELLRRARRAGALSPATGSHDASQEPKQ